MLPRIVRLRLAAAPTCVPRSVSQSVGKRRYHSQHDAEVESPAFARDRQAQLDRSTYDDHASLSSSIPAIPRLVDPSSSSFDPVPSFPLYPYSEPIAGPSRPSNLPGAREAHDADLALLQSLSPHSWGRPSAKSRGKGKGKAIRDISDLPPDHSLLLEAKKRMTDRLTRDVPEYSEEELRAFYVAVVRSGAEGGVEEDRRKGRDRVEGGTGAQARRLGSGVDDMGISTTEGEVSSDWDGSLDGMDGPRVRRTLEGVLSRFIGTEDEVIGDADDTGVDGRSRRVENGDLGGRVLSLVSSAVGPEADGAQRPDGELVLGGAVPAVRVSLGLLSRTEWHALLADRIHCADFPALMQTLRSMEQCSTDIEAAALLGGLLQYSNSLLEGVRSDRRPQGAMQMNERLAALLAARDPATLSPTDHLALISSYLLTPLSPSRAITHLSRSASLGQPAPQSAYTLLLTSLLTSHPTAPRRALAWDVYTDMRLTAHPTPSLEVYRTMIAACGAAGEPKPEVGRDLWIEMNQVYPAIVGTGARAGEGGGREEPGVQEYTAFIKALGSTKGTYLEAFEVMRGMLARHDEATYVPFEHDYESDGDGDQDFQSPGGGSGRGVITQWTPTKDTWKALLEGTKRAGDVERSKWVLLEAAQWAERTGEEMMDEDMVTSVLMAYAAFRPTRTRGSLGVREGADGAQEVGRNETAAVRSEGDAGQQTEQEYPGDASVGDVVAARHEQRKTTSPQPTLTAAQAMAEARGVFDLVRHRSQASSVDGTSDQTDITPTSAPESFKVTPRLVNSFLSVIYAHASSIEACREEWTSTWASVSGAARPNGWSYLHALERCAVGQRHLGGSSSSERQAALSWAIQLWEEYTTVFPPSSPTIESLSNPDLTRAGLGARQIERAWIAIIRTHTLSSSIPTALNLLLDFNRLYPPDLISALYTPRETYPLQIKFTDPTTVPEADVPPHILWKDVDVLHQRLVRDGDVRGVGKVKMVTMGYLRALRERQARRRGEVLGKEKRRGGGKERGLL